MLHLDMFLAKSAIHERHWDIYDRCMFQCRSIAACLPALPTMIVLLSLAALMPGLVMATEYRLYFLGGQSNMDGYGWNRDLPKEAQGTVDGVRIFAGVSVADGESGGGAGAWTALQPGLGTWFGFSDGEYKLSDRFGPELSFGQRLRELDPDRPVALIKFSRGGTALQDGASGYGNWAPDFDGINQYDNALAAIRNALAVTDIDSDGSPDTFRPAGIIWMQGEADAYHSREAADAYQANLKRLMDLLRAALRVDDLPVVIGMISDSGREPDGRVMDYSDTVKQAQFDFVAGDDCAALVRVTESLEYPEDDAWHYNSDGYLKMGSAFADAVSRLHESCGSPR